MSQRAVGRAAVLSVGAAAGAAVVLLSLLVAGLRWNMAPVVDALRRVNRSFTNPRVMRTAGSAGTPTSVIRHVGRTSGRTYETPVDVVTTADGFLIALPYGTRADWVRNVIAAGSATIVSQGESIDVGAPTLVATAEVAGLLPAKTLRTLNLFGVTECLHLRGAVDGPG
jgi:deazaflavin-dependent oxidoreductase (nitroreductase family)